MLRAIVLILALAATGARAATTPVGLWRTFDENTGQARGVVRVTLQDGVLHGRVEQILIPADRDHLCTLCTGARHDKPVLGMEIFDDLHPDGDGWEGHILDPQNGKLYSCHAHLAKDGRELVLRGYLLVSLIGRSQTWQRVDAP